MAGIHLLRGWCPGVGAYGETASGTERVPEAEPQQRTHHRFATSTAGARGAFSSRAEAYRETGAGAAQIPPSDRVGGMVTVY